MKLTDLNPAGGIGANSLLVEVGPFRFVIDSGLHPKLAGNEAMPKFSLVERNSLDFIVLTHCHLDHLGSLPVLSRENPDTPILATQATRAIARRMLSNSVAVMKRQRGELNLPEYPLYNREDVSILKDRFQLLDLEKPFVFEKDGDTLEVTLHHAGHVVGAASCSVSRNGESIFFTGDVLFNDQRILKGAKPPHGSGRHPSIGDYPWSHCASSRKATRSRNRPRTGRHTKDHQARWFSSHSCIRPWPHAGNAR